MALEINLIPVVAAAIMDAAGGVLLQKRRAGGEHGGLWEFPGGKIEPGESPEAALSREIEEELGVVLDTSSVALVDFACDSVSHAGHGPCYVILLYLCREWSGELRCLAGEEIGWFTLDSLADMEMPPLDVPLARALKRACQSRTAPLCAPLPRP
jgi:8-oxo-dGTP diphosphatase